MLSDWAGWMRNADEVIKARMGRIKQQLNDLPITRTIADLKPQRNRDEAVTISVDCFKVKKQRMRYDSCKKRRLPVRLGVTESARKQIVVSWFKRSGYRRSIEDTNALLPCRMSRRKQSLDRRSRRGASRLDRPARTSLRRGPYRRAARQPRRSDLRRREPPFDAGRRPKAGAGVAEASCRSSEEFALRETRSTDVALQTAKLISVEMTESFDFAFQPSLNQERIAALAQLDFIRRRENVHCQRIYWGLCANWNTSLARQIENLPRLASKIMIESELLV